MDKKKRDEQGKRHTPTTQGIVFLVNKIILNHAYILIHQPLSMLRKSKPPVRNFEN